MEEYWHLSMHSRPDLLQPTARGPDGALFFVGQLVKIEDSYFAVSSLAEHFSNRQLLVKVRKLTIGAGHIIVVEPGSSWKTALSAAPVGQYEQEALFTGRTFFEDDVLVPETDILRAVRPTCLERVLALDFWTDDFRAGDRCKQI